MLNNFWLNLQLIKLDELIDEERSIRVALANRGALPGVLMHSIIDEIEQNPSSN